MKKVLAFGLAVFIALSCTGCAGRRKQLVMVTPEPTIMDESFNQLSWQGLARVRDKANISYAETGTNESFNNTLTKVIEQSPNLIWSLDGSTADKIKEIAGENPNISFVVTDAFFEESSQNLTGLTFRSQEASFLAGYIAANTAKNGIIGFIGGYNEPVIHQFERGYIQGAKYANPNIHIISNYCGTFSDREKGKQLAEQQYENGAEVIFQAAGSSGLGVIQAAKNMNKWVIGVDLDQSYLAPKNVLTSVIKKVDVAVKNIADQYLQGGDIGGKNYVFGLKEDGVGLAENTGNISWEIYNQAMTLKEKIIFGEIRIQDTIN